MRTPAFLKEKPKKDCISHANTLAEKIIVKKRIGTDSSYGEAFSACYPVKTCKHPLAVKKIPLTSKEFSYTNPLKSLEILNESETWAELYFTILVSVLKEKMVVPHVPMYYTHYICDACAFENPNLSKSSNKCIILPNDLADGDFKFFLTNTDYSAQTLFQSYIQIFLGILAINLYFGMDHNDLHYGNVLYKKVKKGVNRYTLDSKTYYIPNNGLLFYLWDFGFSTITDFIEPKVFRGRVKKGSDYYRITSMLKPGKDFDSPSAQRNTDSRQEVYSSLKETVKESDKLQMVKNLLETYGVPYSKKLTVVGRYNLDKNIKIYNQPK